MALALEMFGERTQGLRPPSAVDSQRSSLALAVQSPALDNLDPLGFLY
jgi:hypothetical protein